MFQGLSITVMLGGFSAEREVSLKTGAAAAKALRSLGHTVHELDPKDDSWTLAPGTDVVFLALHGTYGEDGQAQARLEKLGVPYTGCDPEASRVAFDKVLTKQRCVSAGVPTSSRMRPLWNTFVSRTSQFRRAATCPTATRKLRFPALRMPPLIVTDEMLP